MLAPGRCISTSLIDIQNNKHGGAYRITNSPHGLVLIGRTASSHKIQRSLPTVFFRPVKGKERARTDSFLLIWSGDEGRELASTWTLTADEKKKLSTHWAKFEGYVAPRSNFRLARYKLPTIKQEPSETVDSILKKVRILVKECKYTNPDEHIIDALIFGSVNPRVQSKLLEHDDTLTLDKTVNIARTQEATSSQLQDIRGSQTTTVNALRQGPHTGQLPAQGNQAED